MVYVSVIIMNLLIALTVSRTDQLQKEAEAIILAYRTEEVSGLTELAEQFGPFGRKFQPFRLMEKLKTHDMVVPTKSPSEPTTSRYMVKKIFRKFARILALYK
jgi:hypothetical protein